MKIYTRTGDDGTTGLIGGQRVKKHDIRLEAYGTIDELNATMGMLRTLTTDEHDTQILDKIQNKLFEIGAELATVHPSTKNPACNVTDIKLLENEMDQMNLHLPELRFFVIPGGCQAATVCHLARTVCRRAERRIVELSENNEVNADLTKFVNRLSDYLFVLSRKLNHDQNMPETAWHPTPKE